MSNIKEQLKKLRTASPSKEALDRGHYFLIARLEARIAEKNQRNSILYDGYFVRVMRDAKAATRVFVKAYVSHIALSLAVVAMLFAGFGAMAAYHAQQAVDGQFGYPLKIALEKAHLTLSSRAKQAELQIALVGERVEETKQLARQASEDTEKGGARVVEAVKKARHQALNARDGIAQIDPNDIDVESIKNQLASYQIALDGFEVVLPEEIQEEVQHEVEELAQVLEELDQLVATEDEVPDVEVVEDEGVVEGVASEERPEAVDGSEGEGSDETEEVIEDAAEEVGERSEDDPVENPEEAAAADAEVENELFQTTQEELIEDSGS